MPQAKSRRQDITALRQRVAELERELTQTQQQLTECQCLQADETLKLYKYAVESSSDAIGFADGTGKHLYQNSAFGSLFECDRPEEFHAAGGIPARFVNREIADEMRQTMIKGESWASEVEMQSCKGRRFQAWARFNGIRDESGRILALIGTISHITARKQAEEALRVSQARFAGIVEIAKDAIISVNSSQRITLFNQEAEKIFGYTAAEVLGQPLSLLLPQRFAAAHEKHVSNFTQSRPMAERSEIFGRRKDGREFPAEASISHLQIGDETIYTAILRDISSPIAAAAALAQSNALLRSVMESTTDAIFVKDLQSRHILLNSTTLELLGKSEAEALGKTTEELFPPHVADSLMQVDRRIISSGVGEMIEETIVDRNGIQRTLLTTKNPWRNEDGTVMGVVGIARDISDRKLAEEALKAQAGLLSFRAEVDGILARSEQLQDMLQECTEAIVERFDAAFARIWTLNQAENVLELQASAGMYTHIDGPHRRVPVGMYKIGLIAAEKQPHLTNSVLEDSRISNKEWAKREGMVAFAGYPLLVEDALVGVIAMFARHPLSESVLEAISLVANEIAIGIKRKQAELALQASEAQLRQQTQNLEQTLRELQRTQSQLIQSEKMSSLGQLVAGVAHEINNPVSFIFCNITHADTYTQDLLQLIQLYQKHYPQPVAEIQAQAEAIDLEFMLEDLPKLLTSMKVGAERIQQIVLSLRTFSRMDEAQIKQVNIHDGIDSTLTILQNRLKAKPDCPEIEVSKDYGNLPLVECYAGQLNQVFMNILCNAIDALEEGHKSRVIGHRKEDQSPIPTIRIRTQLIQPNQVIIQIADNGPGMTETVRQRLFDPFFTTKPVGKGTGMGLSISYQIITERHGGSLQCISSPGQGAEFAIQIPLKQ
ncbi:PAS domain S-box protein [Microseira sp. BLCC-F43]|uniref:PAS domain S-box protein n=1 Tax=Microseira sp. BLCC-F43 TaxID=3153602 RepID=UPI0035B744BC